MIKTLIVLFFAVLAGTAGDLLLSKGMRAIHQEMSINFSNILPFFIKVFTSGTIWIGIGSMAIFFFGYLVALSRADVSYVLPLTALSYVLTAFFAHYFLKEDVNWIRWVGTILIFVGVSLVALSQKPHKPVQEKNEIMSVTSTSPDTKI